MSDPIEQLLSQMTLAEKAAMTAGADFWHTVSLPRLGIPALKVTDGPNGARGGGPPGAGFGPTAACFPVGISLAATWNTALVEQVGAALGEETKTKQAHVLLGPTVNIHRSPLNGRNFECYSEDPHLTARLAVAYINGVQSQGVGACVKHFVCNDSEFERYTISSEVGERALREIYLLPFEAAVKEAHVWAVMSAYNRVNGVYCCDHRRLLTEILREEWGFDGFVVSDWTGTRSTAAAANAGLDLEMPGPARWLGAHLLAAVEAGEVSEAVIDAAVRRLLRTIMKAGVTYTPEAPEQSIDRPEHRALIRRAAAEGIVLLKNDGELLPLDRSTIGRLAVIGPNAPVARMMGGGSAEVNAHYAVSPLDGIHNACGDEVEIAFALGTPNHAATPVLNPAWLTPLDGGGSGWTVAYFAGQKPEGEPVLTQTAPRSRFLWFGDFAPDVPSTAFSARLSGTFTAPSDGRFTFSLTSAGLSRLLLNGRELIDNWTAQRPGGSFFGFGSEEVTAEVDLAAGERYDLVVEFSNEGRPGLGALNIGCLPPLPADLMEQAERLAAESDAVLLFVGTSGEWESEGFDRSNMELPARQNELVERIAAANPRTVVVLNTGSPVTMPWLDKVAAVVSAWFAGQETGNAIADVLFGLVNPSGRLPQTFPRRLEDNPAFINYPGEHGKVVYGEGIFVGYRYYDKKAVEPLFPFGYGLSYTDFTYRDLELQPRQPVLTAQGGLVTPVEVSVAVTNSGRRTGQEVVQLYVRDPVASVLRPPKELKAFAKVELAPGETTIVRFRLGADAFAFYDDLQARWTVEPGEFEIWVGCSSRDLRLSGRLTIAGQPAKSAAPAVQLSKASLLREIAASTAGAEILKRHLGPLTEAPEAEMAMNFSLEQVAQFVPHLITAEKLAAIDQELRALG